MIHSKGFTLIEIMVAVSLIAILSTIGFVSFGYAQKVARDGKRKQDLKLIQTGLELYNQKNGHYPTFYPFTCNGSEQTDFDCNILHDWEYSTWAVCPPDWIYENKIGQGCIKTLDSSYLNSNPVDPINNNSELNASDGYIYYYKSNDYQFCPGDGKWYVLKAQLENWDDKDTVAKRYAAGNPVKWCDGTVLTGQHEEGWRIYPNTYLVIVKS